MSSPPQPRLPARVYWVRRAVVLGIPLLVLVLLVVWLTGRGADDGATPAAQTTTTTPPSDEPAPSTTPSTEPGGVADCDATTLALALTPTAASFPAGQTPAFAVSITNNGSEPCLVDAGEASREIVITSGADRVWS